MSTEPTAHSEDAYEGAVGPTRTKLPKSRAGWTTKLEVGGTEGYITCNPLADGQPGEIFLHGFGKEGSTLEGWTQVAAVLFSIALQYGAEFPMLARKLAHMRFEPNGMTNDPVIPHCHSVPDYIVRWLAHRTGNTELLADLAVIDAEMSR
jgi:ribonucleoside-diphosphate reductase alpha chain